MKTKIITGFLGLIALIGALYFVDQSQLLAVSSNVTITSLVTSTTTVKENSLVPVFKIEFPGVETNEALQTIDVILNSSATGNAETSNVLEDNRIYNGGWQLWKDSGNGTSGTFERFTDEQLFLDSGSLNYGTNGAHTIDLDTDETLSANDTFYVAIHTDNTGLPASSSFTVSLSGITTSGGTQPSFSTVTTSTLSLSVTPKAVKVQLIDGGINEGDLIKIIFNQSMDFSYLSNGLSWYIYQYDSSWNQLSFGDSPTLAYGNDGGASNDTITITLGANPTIVTTRSFYYSLPAADTTNNSYNYWAWGTLKFDSTAPTLVKAELITDVNNDGEANDIGDQIAFMFSEAMDKFSEDGDSNTQALNPGNINTLLSLSESATFDNGGAKPILTWWGPSIVVVTLKNSLTTDLINTTVTPANHFKDIAGNVRGLTSTPTIQASPIAPPTSVILSDIDIANSWIDKNDIGIDYILPSYSSAITSDADFHVDVYLLPENVGFNFSTLYSLNSANLTGSTEGTTYSFDGADSSYSIWYDSRTNYVSIANNDWNNVEYYSIEENKKYVAYVVVSTDAHGSETNAGRSIPRPSEAITFTAEAWSETTSTPWIKSYTPNSSSTPINTKTFCMKWSEELDSDTAGDVSNYTLKYDSDSDWTYDTEITLIDAEYYPKNYTSCITTETTLASNKYHYLQAKSQIEDLYGTSVGSYAGIWFQTGSSTDTTAPTVSSANISNGATDISPSLSSINIVFNENMGALTLSTTSATLDPSVAGVSALYDVSSNALKYTFGTQNMVENTNYTFTLTGSTITDAAGNLLDGDSNGSAGGNYQISFTTGTLDTTKPKITWSTFDGYDLYVGFDKEMKEADVEDYSNWTLTCDNSDQTLSWATFTWDEYNYELKINGLYCSDGASYTISAANNVRGGNNQTIDSDYDTSSGTVESATTSGGSVSGSTTYSTTYSPVYVWPNDSSAGATTTYYVSLPINKAVGDGYQIRIEWPSGFDISNTAAKTTNCGSSSDYNACSYSNNDINGSWNGIYDTSGGTSYSEGVVKLYDSVSGVTCPGDDECISNDTTQNITTLYLWMDYDDDGVRDSTAVTGTSDYLSFDLTGIVNSETANSVDWSTDTGGYQINVSTRTAAGARLEGPLSSSKFSIIAAGTGTFSGKITANTSEGAGIEGATVYASGQTYKSTTTDANGDWSITGAQNGYWYFWVSPPSNGQYTYDYSSYSNSSCEITDSNQSCTYNGTLTSLDYTVSGTIVHAASLSGKEITVWQYGKSDYSWSSVNVTLEADGSTDYTVYVNSGKTEIGIYERYYSNDFQSPDPVTVNVTGNMTGVNFNLTVADKSLPITVLDGDGNGLANVSVGAWSYDDGYGFSTWGQTSTDGTVTLKVVPGEYTAYAYQWGFGNAEKAVSVDDNGTVSPTGGPVFKFKEADSTIAGTVLDEDGNAIQWASISYKDSDGITQWSSTDSKGKYTLWVPGSTGVTGTVTAYSWQHGGNLPAASGVDNTDFAVAANSTITGINFQYDPDAYATISGTITADETGVQYASIWAEEVNAATGNRTGYYGSWASTDSSGNYSLKVTKNSSTTCYNLYGWTSNYGELPKKSCLDVSGGNLTGQNWDLGTLQALTISVANGPTSVNTAHVDIIQTGTDTGIWESLTLANGAATESVEIWDGSYKASLYIDGFGEFAPDSPDNEGFTVSGTDKTISFDLTSISSSTFSLSGQVTDGNGTAVNKARISLFDESTGTVNNTKTDSSGNYTMTAQEGTYTMYASKSSYINSDKQTITASGTYNFTITAASATITGIGYRNSTTVEGAWIIARAGDKWSSAKTNGDGTFTLYVPDNDTTWNIEGMTKNGYSATLRGVSAGASGLTLNMDTQSVTGLADQECTSAVPSQAITLDDEEDTGVSIKVPANSYTDSSGENTRAGTLCVQDIATPSGTTNAVDVVESKEILLNDSEGNSQTKFQSDLDLSFTYFKSDIDTMLSDGSLPACDNLSTLPISYWDESSQTWVSMPTTRSIKVKTTSGSDFTEATYSTAIDNICSDSDFYYDYKIVLRTNSDHLTIFGVVVPSDTTAPAAPAGLSATIGNGQVVLDWNDNTESDLLEYTIYRSTSSSVQAINANQLNASQVTSSTYTDTTTTNGTKYYYRVTAADKSGNESSTSNETSATPTAVTDETAPGAPSGLSATAGDGSVSLNWNDNSEDDLSKYNVYRSTSASVTVTTGNRINTGNVTSSAYTDSSVTNGTKYYYVVTAVDTSNNESGASSEVSATPQAASEEDSSSSSGSAGGRGSSSAADQEDTEEEDGADQTATEESSDETKEPADEEQQEPLTPFTDVIGHWGESYIAELYERGVVQGYDEETFGPDNNLTRAELSKIVLKLWGISAPSVAETPFWDVAPDSWYAGYVTKLRELNVVEGYSDGSFRPDQAINRAEVLKVFLKLTGKEITYSTENPFSDVDEEAWYAPYVLYAYEQEYVSGYADENGNLLGLFGPGNTVTRAEIAKMASLILGF